MVYSKGMRHCFCKEYELDGYNYMLYAGLKIDKMLGNDMRIFLIHLFKHLFWVLKRTASTRLLISVPHFMFLLKNKIIKFAFFVYMEGCKILVLK